MALIETFATTHLSAGRLRAEDLDELCGMFQDQRVMATLGGPLSAEEQRQALLRGLAHWDRYGYGFWMFRDLADGRFVGRAGLRNVEVEGSAEVELAYALRAEYWGRGLATEIAAALLTIAFERLGLERIVAFTLPTNRASRRVMEKAGFTYERDIVHAGMPHLLYGVTAAG